MSKQVHAAKTSGDVGEYHFIESLEQRVLLDAMPVGPEFRVNSSTSNHQDQAAIAMDASGNFVVAWNSAEQDGSGYGVYAQRYNAAGEIQGDEFQVNTYTTDLQRLPAIAMDADGDFVVTWMSYGQDGSGNGIYAQRYNAAGVPQESEFRVNTFTTSGQALPTVAMDPHGNFVVTWGGAGGQNNGVYARRYEASGVPQGADFLVSNGTSDSDVAIADNGDFVVSWVSQDGSDFGVYARRYNAEGVAQGSAFRVNTNTLHNQLGPSVAMGANGDFVVTWDSFGQDGSIEGVYAQRYNAGGMKQGPEFRVNHYTPDSQREPAVATDADGDFVVTWLTYGQDGSDYGIYAQRYNTLGQELPRPVGSPAGLGNEFRVNSYTTGSQFDYALAMDRNGDFVIAWSSDGQDGSGHGIYAQRYAGGSTPGGTIITHGWQLTDSVPGWTYTMAKAIRDHVGGIVGSYDKGTGSFKEVTYNGGSWSIGPDDIQPIQSGENILIFDWAFESGLSGWRNGTKGWSEGAAEALFAAMAELWGGIEELSAVSLHFIGHSRGAVVNSEVVERLGASGVAVDHITNLDPHDFDEAGIPFDGSYRDWELGRPQGSAGWNDSWGMTTWTNVSYADTFWSNESSGLRPNGREPGSKNRPLNLGLALADEINHSDVHAWYHGTIDTTATTDGAGTDIPRSEWYPNTWDSNDGWNYARLGRNRSRRDTDASMNNLSRYDPLWNPFTDGVFNGNFNYSISQVGVYALPGWEHHGGAGDPHVRTIGFNDVLELDVGDASATHNRIYVPADASHLRFRVWINVPRLGTSLTVRLGQTELLVIPTSTATSNFIDTQAVIPAALRNEVNTLTLTVTDGGIMGTPEVWIDDIRLATSPFPQYLPVRRPNTYQTDVGARPTPHLTEAIEEDALVELLG
jgi:hypothetical protein